MKRGLLDAIFEGISLMELFGLVLSTTNLWLLAIAGAGIVLLVRQHLALSLDRTKRRRDAVSVFQRTFTDTLMVIKNTEADPCDLLREDFLKLDTAVQDFCRLTGRCDKRRLQAEWRTLCCYEGTTYQHFEQYSTVGCSREDKQSRRELATSRIHKLIDLVDEHR